MRFEGRKKAGQGINLTPLIDVVFLLLIFFMLTSHFMRDETIPLDLPIATTSTPLEGELLQVVLDNRGQILLKGDVVAPNLLEVRLQQELRNRANKRLQIRGDKAALLEAVITVLDAARHAGAEGVDIITREP